MKVNHYATIYTNKNILPAEKTTRVKSNNIHDLSLPQEAYRVITFDRMVNELEYNGKIYPVATRKLNQKIYHIGKFENLETLARKDELFVKLAKGNNCIGMVTSSSGLESMVFEGEGIVDINNKKEIVIKECTLKIDEVFENENDVSEFAIDVEKTNAENIETKSSNGQSTDNIETTEI